MTETTFDNYPNVAQSFRIAGIIILMLLLMSPVQFVLNNFMSKEASTLIYYLLSFGISFWIVNSRRKNETGNNSFNLTIENKRVIPFIIVSAIVLDFGIIALLGSLMPMPEFLEKAFMEVRTQTGVFTFVTMVIAAPILEELIFRGIVLDGLLKIYTPLKSILISSLLFGLVHLNPVQLVTGFLFGIFSGWVYYHTRSLSLSIIIHAAVNLSAYLMRYFIDIDSLMDHTLVELYGGLTNLITATSGSIIIVWICIYYLKKEFIKVDIKNGNTQPLV